MNDTENDASLNLAQRERLQRLAQRLSDDELAQVVIGTEWSIADTLAHLAFYDRRAEALLAKFARDGVSPSPYDVQTLNDILPHLTRRIPPRAVVEEALAAADAADAVAASVTPDLLLAIRERNEVTPARWVHRKAHLDDIEATIGSF